MDTHHRHKSSSSGDSFTFPEMSPNIENNDSELADHLFSNGKLLFHTFPLQPKSYNFSRTCSGSSKDSLMSSRSTSTNSRSSTSSCSSARTSTSEGSTSTTASPLRTTVLPRTGSRSTANYSNTYYPPAQRWQFMAPVPVLNRPTSQRRKTEYEKQNGSPEKKKHNRKKGYCRRFFGWLVSTCKECHAMEPSKKKY